MLHTLFWSMKLSELISWSLWPGNVYSLRMMTAACTPTRALRNNS